MNEKLTMPALNLPCAQLKLRRDDTGMPQVYDEYRLRWVKLTPEEWVRQHFTAWLRDYRGYLKHRIATEVALTLNDTPRRCDAVIYGDDAKPLMVIEFKAPSVRITQKTFDQIVRYNMVLHVPLLMVSNGMKHICCAIDYDKETYEFLADVPRYSELVDYTE